MVAYSFHPRFVDPILAGTKRQTIRANGLRRHARPGDEMQLYTGMRTKHCKLIRKVLCIEFQPIVMTFGRFPSFYVGNYPVEDHEAFARMDGFADLRDMIGFWEKNHDFNDFKGVIMRWRTPGDAR